MPHYQLRARLAIKHFRIKKSRLRDPPGYGSLICLVHTLTGTWCIILGFLIRPSESFIESRGPVRLYPLKMLELLRTKPFKFLTSYLFVYYWCLVKTIPPWSPPKYLITPSNEYHFDDSKRKTVNFFRVDCKAPSIVHTCSSLCSRAFRKAGE